MLGGLCNDTKGVYEIAHDELVTGHVAQFTSGTSGTEATRGASTATIDAMGLGDAWPEPGVRHLR